MREILFKAKRKNWRELPKEEWWVEGYYVFCRKHHYILPVVNKIIGYDEREDKWFEIDANTLCQYTGLTDKSGRKIWENDIVKTEGCTLDCNNGIGQVMFYQGIWYLDGNIQNSLYDLYGDGEIEVVGNIFDNPELLEVE